MIFSSFEFIAEFMPAALIGFLIASRFGRRAGAPWLVLTSLVFYACWRLAFLPLLLISIGFNFGIGKMLSRTMRRPKLQSLIFVAGVTMDLLALGYYKYAATLFAFLGFHTVAGMPFSDIVLPLGISFFTFTQIGYLVDAREGEPKTADPLSYMLFVTFFPHLTAGPILDNRDIMPQFADPATYRFNNRNFGVGLTIFSIGLAKKVLLADPLSADVAANFAVADTIGMLHAWYAAIAYSLQLYFDFSGYSDMAIGLARMFNIRFPLNFDSPYKATSIIDFWRRWHMTLTHFVTTFVYNPIVLRAMRRRVAKRRGSIRNAAATPGGFTTLLMMPTMLSMALVGIWHGAGLQYLIFGLLHGSYIVMNHAIRVFAPGPRTPVPRRPLSRLLIDTAKVLAVYVAVIVSFVIFRASSTAAGLHMVAGMAGLRGLGREIPSYMLAWPGILLLIVWTAPNTQQIMCRYQPALGPAPVNPYAWVIQRLGRGHAPEIGRRPPNSPGVMIGVLTGLLFWVTLKWMAIQPPTEFLYFNF